MQWLQNNFLILYNTHTSVPADSNICYSESHKMLVNQGMQAVSFEQQTLFINQPASNRTI